MTITPNTFHERKNYSSFGLIHLFTQNNITNKKPKSHISKYTDFTSYGHDELVEFAQPHEITGYAPEHPIPYLPVDVAYDNHYPVVPHAHAQYGPPPLLDSPHSHFPNYISTDRKGKSFHKWTKKKPHTQIEKFAKPIEIKW